MDAQGMTISPNTSPSSGIFGLEQSWRLLNQSTERLATGLRINRGSDDPSGLITAEILGSRLSEIRSSISSFQRTNSTLAIEEGMLAGVGALVSDLDGLVLQGANSGALGDGELDAIAGSAGDVVSSIRSQLGSAGSDVLDAVSVQRQVGTDPDTGNPIYESVGIDDLPAMISEDPEAAQAIVDAARGAVVERRAAIGAEQRANESETRALQIEQINVARSRSLIRDANFAHEASESVRASVLGEASMRVMLIGRLQSRRVLDLLA